MQRYRVNYKLMIGLVVGSIVLLGGSYFLWSFQIDRNATRLLEKADVAEKEGKVEDAYKSLDQYVRLRTDEKDARVRFGHVALKIIEAEDQPMATRQEAFMAAIGAVRFTNDPKLRRALVDLQMKSQQFEMALQNIDELIAAGVNDAKLKGQKAQCLFFTQKAAEGAQLANRLIGYDSKTDSFDNAKAEAPDQPIVYALLAQHLKNTREPEKALRVLDQMVAANPESREAYFFKFQFLRGEDDDEGARAALEKAYELDPTNDQVLSSKGAEAINDYQKEMTEAEEQNSDEKRAAAKAKLDEAAKFFAEAVDKYPERVGFYQTAAQIDSMREKPDEAMQMIDRGLKKFPLRTERDPRGLPAAIGLVNLKIEILLGKQRLDEVKAEIKTLRELNNTRVNSLADFHEARVLAVSDKWAEAAAKLQAVKPKLLSFPELQGLAGAIQGFCHTQLGQFDLAYEAYEWALEKAPNLPQARAGLNEMRKYTNQGAVDDQTINIDQTIQAMLAKPKAEQDWDSVTAAIDKYIDEQAAMRPLSDNWINSRKQLLRGQMLALRAAAAADQKEREQLYAEARTAITGAYRIDPDDPTVQIAAIRLLAQEPNNGPAIALKRLDQIVAKSKDSAAFRVLRIELLTALRDDQLPTQLEAATQGMEEWPANQQAMVWSAVGARFEQIGKYADASRCMEKAADLAPNSLPNRMALFELAIKQGNDAAMQQAQAKILEIVKDEDDPGYVLTEVKRRIIGFANGSTTKEQLVEARAMLDKAIKQRPGMADLYVARGQLWMLIEENAEQALIAFDEALKHGPANYNAVALQVNLLAKANRIREARQRLDKIPLPLWSGILGRMAADLLRTTGEIPAAFAEAKKVLDANPDDPATLLWFSDIAMQAEKFEESEAALKKAVEVNPSDPDTWTRLVTLYLRQKRGDDIEQALRDAHLALDEEFLPLLTGRYYELQSRWQEAEDIYLAAYAGKEEDLAIAHRMAEFYLNWMEKSAENRGKAAVWLNRILRAANEGKAPSNDPNVLFARQQAARLLSTGGDYQDSLKAERLLSSAVEGSTPTIADQNQLVDLLSLRGDPVSRERAVQLLRAMQQQGALTPERDLQLGHLLFELNRWEEAKSQLEDAIGRNPTHLGLQTAFTSMLIQKKEFPLASQWISRLNDNKDAARAVMELRLRLAAAQGNKDEIRAALTAMTPNLRALNAEQLQSLRGVAQLAEGVGDSEYALSMIREFARRSPGNELELARYTAMYGPVDEGLSMLKQVFDSNIDDVLALAVNMLRARRAEAADKLDPEITRLVQAARRDDPESARRMVLEAETLEIQEKLPEAIAAYKALLARDDVPRLVRATAYNNAAFLVALGDRKQEDLEQALEWVDQAMAITGPLSDILDTRALVYLARGEFDKAVVDMETAIKMGITPSKYFHLAAAYLGAGNEKAALEAWEKAVALGISGEKVPKPERPELEAFQKKIEALGSSTAQL